MTTPTRLRIVPDAIVQIKRRLIQSRSLMKVHPGYEVTPDTVLAEGLKSRVYGVVDKVDLKKGEVMIRTQATIIFGVAGSGGEREGTLRMLSDNPGLLVSSHQISADFSDQVVVGGNMVFADALQKCVSLNINALVTGGINASEFRTISGGEFHLSDKHWFDVGMTLLVTEGFGSADIGQDIYQTLRSHDGHFCLIDGNHQRLILPTKDQNSMMYIRKAAVGKNPLLPVGSVIKQELKVGSRVRIISADGLGTQGVVNHIDKTPTVLPNGLAVIMTTVDCKRGKKQVALENVEIY